MLKLFLGGGVIQFILFLLVQMGVKYYLYMDVSKNKDTQKWMVYNGKPY